MEALYMTVITLTTGGYGEVRDLDTTGQLWTRAILIAGAGALLYAAALTVEIAVEGAAENFFKGRG